MSDFLSRLEKIFTDALAVPAPERPAFLRTACAGEPELLDRAAALLAAHSRAGNFLEAPAGSASPFAVEDLVGRTFGPYRLIERLGEGGLGVVYAAEQTEPLRRTVALKVIKPGMDTREVLARFEAERHVLALMDHPGIARVFDAGVTPEGRPFFVMELVRGAPITRYCDDRQLPPRERLELLRRVCHAVQHAHQKGVIHRDLKPSNLLVTADGQPKIIDFGIAKATSGPLLAAATLTTGPSLVGTPAYMSPEQAGSANIHALDTRSDVYALGVLLYELLTGRPPHAPAALLAAGLDEMRRRIREDEPARPSNLLATLDHPTLQTAARLRRLEPPRLIALVAGELDWIVLRCLEKDRDRRYPTAAALADDLDRFLRDEPVAAAAPSRVYLARKFLRRHRAVALTAAAFATLLVAATVISATLALRARRAERLAAARATAEAAARARAETAEKSAATAATTSRAVVDFLRQDILQQASPEEQPDRALTVRDAIDRAAAKLDTRFPTQPLVEAAIRLTLGRAYAALGRYDVAQQQHERAYALRRTALGDDDRLTQQALNNVIIGFNDLGRHTDAARLARESVATLTRVYGADDEQTVQTQQTLGSTLIYADEFAEAERVLTDALARARRLFGPAHADTVVILSNLAVCQIQTGRLTEAEPLLRELLTIREKALGPDHPRTLYVVQNLSAVCAKLSRLDEAAALAERVYTTRARTLGEDHPQTHTAAFDLAEVRKLQSRPADALPLYRLAYTGRLKNLGPDHPQTRAAAAALATAERR